MSAAAHSATQTSAPASCTSTSGFGTVAWSNAGNAVSDNASYASASVDGTTTNYLSCTNYGFTIPAGSRIDGITVVVERKSDRTSNGGSNDAAMRIVKGGTIGTADRSTATTYTTAPDVTEAHGGATDLWGQSWTATDINATNFGAAFAAIKPDANGPAHLITVDVISITVTYTPAPTVVSINRASADPTGAATVDWTVTFSESVSGVDTSDFALAISGLSGSSIASVSGGPTVYTVTADTGFGTGTLGLNLSDNDSILSTANAIALGGTGAGNGDFIGQAYTVNRPPPVASFNVVEPAANAVTGRIFTKIAGQDISVDIVALDSSNNVSTSFTGTVAVELVDNTSGGACAGLPLIKALANQTFVALDNGRHALSAGQFEAEAWRNVKFRVKYPTSSPTVTTCSSDGLAIRPNVLANFAVSDSDWQTAGTARTLDDLTFTRPPPDDVGKIHKAGRPFSVRASAMNGAGSPAKTTNYSGTASANFSPCSSGAACTATVPMLSVTFTFASGDLVSDVASYPDVGAFQLQLVDETFANVDNGDTAGDCTSAGRYVCSGTVNVGRFVPDHLAIASSSIVPRSDIAGCAGSIFTYLGERMDLQMSLEARDAGGSVTSRYAGTWARLDVTNPTSYTFGAIDSTAPTLLTSRLTTLPVTASWSAGVATVTAPIAIGRAAGPDGPFTATKIGIAPVDLDGVALGTLNLDADNNASNERGQVGGNTELRFGLLRLDNAVGSERLDLPVPIQLQYYTGTTFAKNTADTCTSINAANIGFSSYLGGITATNMNSANISGLGTAFSSGFLTLTRPLPQPASTGAVTLTINLTGEAKSYLKGNWGVPTYTADPSSRDAFGFYGIQGQPNSFIYFRENY